MAPQETVKKIFFLESSVYSANHFKKRHFYTLTCMTRDKHIRLNISEVITHAASNASQSAKQGCVSACCSLYSYGQWQGKKMRMRLKVKGKWRGSPEKAGLLPFSKR